MEKLLSVFNLCKTAREKGILTSINYSGTTLDFYHQLPGSYEIVIHITAYLKTSDAGLDEIERYLKELIA